MTDEEILKQKYPAKAHARRVVTYLDQNLASSSSSLTRSTLDTSLFYLEGTPTKYNEDNDQACPFRQRRYFFWMTGVDLPDCKFVYDVEKDHSTLFIPPVDQDDVIWSGMPLGKDEGLEKLVSSPHNSRHGVVLLRGLTPKLDTTSTKS